MAVKKEAKSTSPLKYRVLTIGPYLQKAVEVFGGDNKFDNALALLYSENEVIQVIERKGEQKFVAKI